MKRVCEEIRLYKPAIVSLCFGDVGSASNTRAVTGVCIGSYRKRTMANGASKLDVRSLAV